MFTANRMVHYYLTWMHTGCNLALEAEDLDLDPMIENGPVVIEWPEKIDAVLTPRKIVGHHALAGR